LSVEETIHLHKKSSSRWNLTRSLGKAQNKSCVSLREEIAPRFGEEEGYVLRKVPRVLKLGLEGREGLKMCS
jgi:hypothetical protein